MHVQTRILCTLNSDVIALEWNGDGTGMEWEYSINVSEAIFEFGRGFYGDTYISVS